MTPELFRSVLRSRNTSFPPHNTPTHALKKIFQNRFWPLEKVFLLIYAWEGLKSCHFRGSYLELFRPNDELPECFLADLKKKFRACVGVLWGGNQVFWDRRSLQNRSGVISEPYEAFWRIRKFSSFFIFLSWKVKGFSKDLVKNEPKKKFQNFFFANFNINQKSGPNKF